MPPCYPASPRPRQSGSGNQTIGYLGKRSRVQVFNPLTIGTTAFDIIKFGSSLRGMESPPCLLLQSTVVPLLCCTHAIECTNAPLHRYLTMYLHLASIPSLYPRSGHYLTLLPPAGQPTSSSTHNALHNILSKHQDPLRLTSTRRMLQVYLMLAFEAAT